MHAAGLAVLHFQHPFQFIACLVQHIRDAVSALRNADAVAEHPRVLPVGNEQVCHGFCTRHHVSAIVSGIVPATADVYLVAGVINSRQRVVTGGVTECVILYFCAAALKIEHPHRIIQQAIIHIFADGKGIGLIQSAAGDVISSRLCDCGEVSCPVGFIRHGIELGCGKLAGIHDLTAVLVDNGKAGLICYIPEYCRFGFLRLIAHLVGDDRRCIGQDIVIFHLGIVHQFYLDIVQVDGVRVEILPVFQSAVEHQLGHDICVLFHGKLIIDGLRLRGKINAFPGIRLVCAAVLLDHRLNIAVCGRRDLIADMIHAVFVERNHIIIALHGIIQLPHRIDLER